MKKCVLVTGANHGLGLSLIKVFLAQGFTVIAGVYQAHDDSEIRSIEADENLHLVSMDVSDTQCVKEAADFISGSIDSLDIIINNVGILCRDSFSDEDKTILGSPDVDSMLETFNVNALGAIRVANAFSRLLLKSSDKLLINISSEAGSVSDCARTHMFGYCMSKTAMNMAGALIHNELAKHGGQVWQIHPGWMQTFMHGEKNEKADYSPDYSAECIYNLIQNAEAYKSQSAIFMDLFGKHIPW